MPIINRLLNFIQSFWKHQEEKDESDTLADSSSSISYPWENDPYIATLGVDIDKNKVGTSGEAFFVDMFTNGNMNVEFLGDKAPDVDCLVSFNDLKQNKKRKKGDKQKRDNSVDKVYEFLVQVKSSGTIVEHDRTNTVNSGINKQEYINLSQYHMPTYLARIDVNKKVIYMKPAFSPVDKTDYSVVSKKWSLSFDTLTESKKVMRGIATDVKKYWEEGMKESYKRNFKSYFADGK